MIKLYKVIFLLFFISSALKAQTSGLPDLVASYTADNWALKRVYKVTESEEYYQRFSKFYSDWIAKLDTIDFNKLNQQAKVDYVLLKNEIEKSNYFLGLAYKDFKNLVEIADFEKDLYPFIVERRRGKRPDSKRLAEQMTKASVYLKQKIKDANNNEFKDWLAAEKASKIVTSFKGGLEEAYNFYYDYDPEFTWWVAQPYKELVADLNTYSEVLKTNYSKSSIKDDGSGIVGKPIGRDAIIKSLEFEFIPYSPEALIAAAQKQFDWCKAEMIKASKDLGYGSDWKAALEHVKNTYVPVGDQPAEITNLYNQSVNFIEERDLITIPDLAKETWQMIMMTPERQKINPFFTGGWEISISYPTASMDQADKLMSMRGNNPNFSRATVQHELLPGHNLQFFMNSRNKTYRRSFDTPFWMEGWALYWEINLWNKEFPETPEQKLGMLFWRIHRCARIIFSLQYHLGKMTPQECINMLVEDVGHEYANAEAEVRRSFASGDAPLYQVAYMTGGLQFYALRNEMLAKGWTEKQFHDRVLKENMMPVEMLRNLIQDLPIKSNYKTNWKFSTEFN